MWRCGCNDNYSRIVTRTLPATEVHGCCCISDQYKATFQHAAAVPSPTCFAHERLNALPLRPALVRRHLRQEGCCAFALQGRVSELDDEPVRADLPVVPAVGALEAAQQRDGAAEVRHLLELHWGEAGVSQGTA